MSTPASTPQEHTITWHTRINGNTYRLTETGQLRPQQTGEPLTTHTTEPVFIANSSTFPGARTVSVKCTHCNREHTHGVLANQRITGEYRAPCGTDRHYWIDADAK